VEKLDNDKTGVAVHLQMSMNFNAGGASRSASRN
jgi:hypothetical protein